MKKSDLKADTIYHNWRNRKRKIVRIDLGGRAVVEYVEMCENCVTRKLFEFGRPRPCTVSSFLAWKPVEFKEEKS